MVRSQYVFKSYRWCFVWCRCWLHWCGLLYDLENWRPLSKWFIYTCTCICREPYQEIINKTVRKSRLQTNLWTKSWQIKLSSLKVKMLIIIGALVFTRYIDMTGAGIRLIILRDLSTLIFYWMFGFRYWLQTVILMLWMAWYTCISPV